MPASHVHLADREIDPNARRERQHARASRSAVASRATYPTPPAGPSVKAWVLSEQDRGQIFAPQSRRTATDPIHLTTYPDGSYGVPKDPNRPVFQSVGAPIATTVDWAAAAPWLAILGGIGLLAGLLVGASQKSG